MGGGEVQPARHNMIPAQQSMAGTLLKGELITAFILRLLTKQAFDMFNTVLCFGVG